MNKKIFIIFIAAFWAKPVFALGLSEIAKLSNPVEQLEELKKYNEEKIDHNDIDHSKQASYLKIYETYNGEKDAERLRSRISLSRSRIKGPSVDFPKEKEAAKEQLLQAGQEAAELMNSVAEQVATLKESSILREQFIKHQEAFGQYIKNLKDEENSIQNFEDLKKFTEEASKKIEFYKKGFQQINDALGSKVNTDTEFQQVKNLKDGKKLSAEEGDAAEINPNFRTMYVGKKTLSDLKNLPSTIDTMLKNNVEEENKISSLIKNELSTQKEDLQQRIGKRKKGQTGEELNTNPEMEKLLVNMQTNLSNALQKNSASLEKNEKVKSEITESLQNMQALFQYLSETTEKAFNILEKTLKSAAFSNLETNLKENSKQKNKLAPLFKLIQSDYKKFKEALSSTIEKIKFDGNENIDLIKEKLQKSEILKTEIEERFSIYQKCMIEINNAIGLYNKNPEIMNVTNFVTFLQNLIEGKNVESNTAANEKKVKEKGPITFDVKKDANNTEQLIRCLKDADCIKALNGDDVKKAFRFNKADLEKAYTSIKSEVSKLKTLQNTDHRVSYTAPLLGMTGGTIKDGNSNELSKDFETILSHALNAFKQYHTKVAQFDTTNGSKKLSTEDRTKQLQDFKQQIKDAMQTVISNSQPA
jgi:hypothetical protein